MENFIYLLHYNLIASTACLAVVKSYGLLTAFVLSRQNQVGVTSYRNGLGKLFLTLIGQFQIQRGYPPMDSKQYVISR
jgi:hypothetical protein